MTTHSTSLRHLTPDELDTYHEQGYVLVRNLFSPEELAAIDAEIDRICDEDSELDRDSIFIGSLGRRTPRSADICADERILTLIKDLVKPGIAIYSAKLVQKAGHDQTICHWHQDDAYYSQNSASDCRLSIWLPLQDTTLESGCMQIVPGSHKRGLQEAKQRDYGFCALAFKEGADPLPDSIKCPVMAGDMLIFSALLWHSSGPNNTPNRRRAFIVSYQEATCPRGNGEQHVILREP